MNESSPNERMGAVRTDVEIDGQKVAIFSYASPTHPSMRCAYCNIDIECGSAEEWQNNAREHAASCDKHPAFEFALALHACRKERDEAREEVERLRGLMMTFHSEAQP